MCVRANIVIVRARLRRLSIYSTKLKWKIFFYYNDFLPVRFSSPTLNGPLSFSLTPFHSLPLSSFDVEWNAENLSTLLCHLFSYRNSREIVYGLWFFQCRAGCVEGCCLIVTQYTHFCYVTHISVCMYVNYISAFIYKLKIVSSLQMHAYTTKLS